MSDTVWSDVNTLSHLILSKLCKVDIAIIIAILKMKSGLKRVQANCRQTLVNCTQVQIRSNKYHSPFSY